jgi:inorganic triphosphatase YgiF
MEVEKKFRIEDAAHFDVLSGLDTLGVYRLRHAELAQQQHNTYYDTADRTLEQRRYGLRIREIDGKRIATLKGKGASDTQAGLFKRDEWEIEADDPHPATWPASEAREQGLALLGDAPLMALLTIYTRRQHIFAAPQDEPGREVAEFSLDEGHIDAGGQREPFRELEIELLPDGTEDDLAALEAALREYIALEPEQRSKLQRGLALLEASNA